MKAQLLGCLLAFHAPNQHKFLVESVHIIAVRPDGHDHFAHLSKNAHAIIYTTAGNFAIAETEDAIVKMIEDCETNRSR